MCGASFEFWWKLYLCGSQHNWHFQMALYKATIDDLVEDHASHTWLSSASNATNVDRLTGMQLRATPLEVWLDSGLQGVLPLAAADRDIWCVPAAAKGSRRDCRPLQRDWGGAIRIKCSASQTLNHSVMVAVSLESSTQWLWVRRLVQGSEWFIFLPRNWRCILGHIFYFYCFLWYYFGHNRYI